MLGSSSYCSIGQGKYKCLYYLADQIENSEVHAFQYVKYRKVFIITQNQYQVWYVWMDNDIFTGQNTTKMYQEICKIKMQRLDLTCVRTENREKNETKYLLIPGLQL